MMVAQLRPSLTKNEEQVGVGDVHRFRCVPVPDTPVVVVEPEPREGQAHQHEDREPQAEDGPPDHVVSDVL